MMLADAIVRSRWFFQDQNYFGRHPERTFRVRSLYPMERIPISPSRWETPQRDANVLKIVSRAGSAQAVKYHDKATVVAALDTDEAAQAAFDMLSVEECIDVRHAVALAVQRKTGLQ